MSGGAVMGAECEWAGADHTALGDSSVVSNNQRVWLSSSVCKVFQSVLQVRMY